MPEKRVDKMSSVSEAQELGEGPDLKMAAWEEYYGNPSRP